LVTEALIRSENLSVKVLMRGHDISRHTVILAGEALAVLDLHHLPGPRMERIEDQNLERRTPGIVTLSRAAWASRGYPAPWRRRLAAMATRFTTEIIAGLADGERVASLVATGLKDGDRVRVAERSRSP
jgi:hypothetical protein